ncbi:uncharacterized protein LOC112581204 isoform X1 [Bubalus bubalis]|uniref:uncharacterized protein LOC112581204 isoform X1 n=1 Tax=Bubalus bubalis TaxID=89462 RepID=UPI000DBCB1CB|nr:uncharacterized protein LOC112581204 isoform X1 [Bubalus bubalis]
MQYKKSSLHSIFSITKYVDSLKSRLFAGTTLTSAALPLPLTIASIKATERLFHTLTSSTHTLVGQWSANSPEPWSASTPGCTVRARSFLLHSSIPHSWRKLSAGQLRRQHRSSPASVECAPVRRDAVIKYGHNLKCCGLELQQMNWGMTPKSACSNSSFNGGASTPEAALGVEAATCNSSCQITWKGGSFICMFSFKPVVFINQTLIQHYA